MRRVISALGLMMLFAGGTGLRAEVAPPVDTREPVRLTMEQCLSMGLENNPQLELKKAQVAQAESQVQQATASRYPTVNFSANAVRSNRLPSFSTGGFIMMPTSPGVANPSGGVVPGLPTHIHLLPFPSFEITSDREGDIYGFKLEAQYALYTGGRSKNGILIAQLNKAAAEEELRLAQNELTYNIEQAFLGVLLAQEAVKVVDDAYNTVYAHYRQVLALYNEGLVSNLDVIRVEAALAQIQPQRVQARNNVKMAQLGLNNLLNIDLDTPVEAIGALVYEPHLLQLPEDLYAQALSNRPEMRVMGFRKEMALKMIEIARASSYPVVALFANYSWDRGQDMPPNDTVWRDGFQAGVVVTAPLFNGGATAGKVAEAVAMLQQVEAGTRALDLGIRTQVQAAILGLRAAEEKIAAEKANVEAAMKAHNVAKARYAAGLAANVDVLDAQTQLMQAKMNYLVAVYNYNLAWLQLQAALGMPAKEENGP